MVTVIVYLLKSAQRRLPGYISLLSLCCRYGVRLSCYIVLGFCACMAVWWSMSAALYSPATLLSTAVNTVRWLCHGFLFLSHPPTSRSLLFDLLTRQNKCYVMECGNLRHVAAVVTCCTTMPPRTRLFPSQCTHHTHADSLPE